MRHNKGRVATLIILSLLLSALGGVSEGGSKRMLTAANAATGEMGRDEDIIDEDLMFESQASPADATASNSTAKASPANLQRQLAKVIYLNPKSGDDEADGISEANAVKTFERAKELVADNGEIYMTQNVDVQGDMDWDGTDRGKITLRKLYDTGRSAPWILITEGNSLTLTNIIFDGTKFAEDHSHNGSVIQADGGTLIMQKGSEIKNCGTTKTNLVSSGVRVTNGGKFIMKGGAIRNCSAQFGGGVFVGKDTDFPDAKGATFEMYEGSVIEDCSSYQGAGVFVHGEDAHFIMHGGTIQRCELVALALNDGAAVMVSNGADMVMKGGLITDNTLEYYGDSGAAVAIQGSAYHYFPEENASKFTMYDGDITNNKSLYAGAVSVGSNQKITGTCEFIMNGGTISGNQALIRDRPDLEDYGGYGGAVNIYGNGSMTMTAGTIANNTSEGFGGAVLVWPDAVFDMSGGTIESNTARMGGGGILYVGGTVKLSGTALVTDNKADSELGDGIYVNGDHLYLTGEALVRSNNDVYLISNKMIHVIMPYTGAASLTPIHITSVDKDIEDLPTPGTKLVDYEDADGEAAQAAAQAEFRQIFKSSSKMDQSLYIGQSAADPKVLVYKAKPQKLNYLVTYDVNGGDPATTPPDEYVLEGDYVTEPENPARTDYLFKGWGTTGSDTGTYWNFTSDVMPSSHLILYAQWEKKEDPPDPKEYYQVTFDVNGGDPATTPDGQRLEAGSLVSRPANPDRDGFIFKGWIINPAVLDVYWDFDNDKMPSHDMILYARWSYNGGGNGGSSDDDDDYTTPTSSASTVPPAIPVDPSDPAHPTVPLGEGIITAPAVNSEVPVKSTGGLAKTDDHHNYGVIWSSTISAVCGLAVIVYRRRKCDNPGR